MTERPARHAQRDQLPVFTRTVRAALSSWPTPTLNSPSAGSFTPTSAR